MPRYYTRPAPPPQMSGKSVSMWVRPRAFYVEDEVERKSRYPDTPSVPEHVAVDTGLIDMKGDTIWRAPNPIGFRFGDDA